MEIDKKILESKILIVDDDIEVGMTLEEVLRDNDYHRVRYISDPREAAPAYQEFHPDLVMLDIRMPHLDGFGVLRGLRMDETLRPIPVVVLSAAASVWEQRDGWEAGADAYVVKPFLPDALVGTVEWVAGMSFGERLRHRERILSFIAAQRVS